MVKSSMHLSFYKSYVRTIQNECIEVTNNFV